jgi:hypothetical protein
MIMTKHKPLPSQERLQELFDYSVVTGELRWRTKSHPKANRCIVGNIAGNKNGDGYLQISVDNSWYAVHRTIWKLVTGVDPGSVFIDHVDRDRLNNAWHNLRLSTNSQNGCNRSKTPHNTTGYKGVFRNGSGFIARIKVHQRTLNLGTFPTPEEAHAAYCKAAAELHGDFARTH